MRKRRVWTLQNKLAELRNWLEDTGNTMRLRDKPRKQIEDDLGRSHKSLREKYGPISIRLGFLATWYSKRGAGTVLCADTSGWKNLSLGLHYKSWGIRLRFALMDREGSYDRSPLTCSLLYSEEREPHWLAEILATGEDTLANGLGKQLVQNFKRTGGGDKVYFYTVPFAPFMFKLYCLWVGQEVTFRDDVPDPLGPYQSLIDAWNDPDEFPKQLLKACDYHCEQTFDDPKGYPAFTWMPYNVFPVEILAIQRVRRDLGLPTPEIEHPLLESPLAHPPATLPEVHDELLDKVIAQVKVDFPEIGNPW